MPQPFRSAHFAEMHLTFLGGHIRERTAHPASKNAAHAKNATPNGMAFFYSPALATGLPSHLWAMVISTAPTAGFPGRFPLFRAASMAVALAGCLLFFGLAGLLSSSRIITGTLLIAIGGPNWLWFVFSSL
jgi:hypothetical protein